MIAYRREQRALRRRRRLRRFLPAQAGIMPLIASILAVCLIAGMMLSVFTISPVESPGKTRTPGAKATTQPAPARSTPRPSPHRTGQPSATPHTSATP